MGGGKNNDCSSLGKNIFSIALNFLHWYLLISMNHMRDSGSSEVSAKVLKYRL
jgi:hypothetical protein